MPTAGGGAVGAINYPAADRRELAAQSRKNIPSASCPERTSKMIEMHRKLLKRIASAAASSSDNATARAAREVAGVKPMSGGGAASADAPVARAGGAGEGEAA